MKKLPFSARLEQSQRERIRELAQRTGLSESEVLRRSLGLASVDALQAQRLSELREGIARLEQQADGQLPHN